MYRSDQKWTPKIEGRERNETWIQSPEVRWKTKYGWVFVTIAISVTFISNETIGKLSVKLYVNLCVVDLRLRAQTIVDYRNYSLHRTNLAWQRHLYYSEKATVTFVPYQTSDRWVGKRATERHQKSLWKASYSSSGWHYPAFEQPEHGLCLSHSDTV